MWSFSAYVNSSFWITQQYFVVFVGDEQAGMEPGEGGPDSRDGGEELEYESPEERDDEEPEDDGAGYDEDQFNGEEEEEEEDWRNENEEVCTVC